MNEPLRAFLFDARFMSNKGVACLVKIMSGTLNMTNVRHLQSYHKNKKHDVFDVGVV